MGDRSFGSEVIRKEILN